METRWSLVGFAISSLVLLAGTRMLTSFLARAEYGKLALAISIVNIFHFISAGPLNGGVIRFYGIAKEQGGYHALLEKLFKWLGWSLGGLALVSLLVFTFSDAGGDLILITTFLSVFWLLNQASIGVEEAARRRRVVAVFRFLFEAGRFTLAYLLITRHAATGEWALTGFALAAFAVVTMHGIYLRKRVFTRDTLTSDVPASAGNGIIRERFMPFVLPLIISGICTWPHLMLDRWCLKWFCDIESTGLYSAVYQLGFIPASKGGAFLVILISPILFQHIGDGSDHENKNKAFRANFLFSLALLTVILALFLVLLASHSWFARYLLGEAFRHGSWMLPWLFLAGGAYAVALQLLLRVSGDMKTYKLAIVSLAMVVVSGVVYPLAAAFWGQSGVVFAAPAVNIVYLSVALMLGRISRPLDRDDEPSS